MTLIQIANMNERIKELEKQCWSHRVDGVLVDGHLHFDTQKFAELIVKECVAICQDTDGEDNIDARSGRQDCAVEIQEHFGVKE